MGTVSYNTTCLGSLAVSDHVNGRTVHSLVELTGCTSSAIWHADPKTNENLKWTFKCRSTHMFTSANICCNCIRNVFRAFGPRRGCEWSRKLENFRCGDPIAVTLFGGEAVQATVAYFETRNEWNGSSSRDAFEAWKVNFQSNSMSHAGSPYSLRAFYGKISSGSSDWQLNRRDFLACNCSWEFD